MPAVFGIVISGDGRLHVYFFSAGVSIAKKQSANRHITRATGSSQIWERTRRTLGVLVCMAPTRCSRTRLVAGVAAHDVLQRCERSAPRQESRLQALLAATFVLSKPAWRSGVRYTIHFTLSGADFPPEATITCGSDDATVCEPPRSHDRVRDAFRGAGVDLLQPNLALPLEGHDVCGADNGKATNGHEPQRKRLPVTAPARHKEDPQHGEIGRR